MLRFMRRCRRSPRAAVARMLFGAVMTLALLMAGHGRVPNFSHERFPCESCGCGCASALACWTNCCCYTPAERMAWAAAHGVEPPAELRGSLLAQTIAQAKSQSRSPTRGDPNLSDSPTGSEDDQAAVPHCACGAESDADLPEAPSPRQRTPAECKGKPSSAVAAPMILFAQHTASAIHLIAPCVEWLGPIAAMKRPDAPPLERTPPPPRFSTIAAS
jgi:hypothetical protein